MSMDKLYSFDKSELDTIFGPNMNALQSMQHVPLSLKNLPELTGTSKSCYIKSPLSNLTDMNFVSIYKHMVLLFLKNYKKKKYTQNFMHYLVNGIMERC